MKKSRYISSNEIFHTINGNGRPKFYRAVHLKRMAEAQSAPGNLAILITKNEFRAWVSDPANAKYLRAPIVSLEKSNVL